MADINSGMSKLLKCFEMAGAATNDQSLLGLQTAVEELRDIARETWQAKNAGAIMAAAEKLKKGGPISAEERQLVRTAIVGDAEAYLRAEKDYPLWAAQLSRIMSEIRKLAKPVLTSEELVSMRALLTDASNLLPQIQKYAAAKGRVDRFNKATETIDAQEADMLAQTIINQMSSKNV